MEKEEKIILSENELKDKYDDINHISNKILCGETLSVLKRLPNKSVHMILTSPSYYLGKNYEKEHTFEEYIKEHKEILIECKRILKDNGAIFWNVAQTIIEGETVPLGAIFYNIFKEMDFTLKNWIIWKFEGGETPRSRLFGRYENVLWFVKDKNNYTFNVDEIRIPSKWINDSRCNKNGKNPEDFWVFDERNNLDKLQLIKKNMSEIKKLLSINSESYVNQILMDELFREIEIETNSILESKDNIIQKNLMENIWHINRVVNVSKSQKIKHPISGEVHPCPFPEKLIERIIKMSTNEGYVVVDIFNGSGTVTKMSNLLNRKWIGIDKEKKYCEIAEHRIKNGNNEIKKAKKDVSINNN